MFILKSRINKILKRYHKKGYKTAQKKLVPIIEKLKKQNATLRKQHTKDKTAYGLYKDDKKMYENLYDVLEMDSEEDLIQLTSIIKRFRRKYDKITNLKRRTDKKDTKIRKLLKAG